MLTFLVKLENCLRLHEMRSCCKIFPEKCALALVLGPN